MVERQLPKLNVAGSNPVFRLYFFIIFGDFFIAKGNGASYVNVVDAIAGIATDHFDKPLSPVTIKHIEIKTAE